MSNFKIEKRYSGMGVCGLVLDMQPRLLDGILAKDALLEGVSIFCEAMSLFEVQTVITEQVPSKLGFTCEEISERCTHSPRFAKKTFPLLEKNRSSIGLSNQDRSFDCYGNRDADLRLSFCN